MMGPVSQARILVNQIPGLRFGQGGAVATALA
jgi:hypothetical protein